MNGLEFMKKVKNGEFKNGDRIRYKNSVSTTEWKYEGGDFWDSELGTYLTDTFMLIDILDGEFTLLDSGEKPEKFRIEDDCLYYKNGGQTPDGYSKNYSSTDIQFAKAINWLIDKVSEEE